MKIVDLMYYFHDMMNTLCWDKLHERWNKQLLVIVFKFFKCLHRTMHHLTSQHSLFSHLQSIPNAQEANLVIHLSSHFGITIKGNGPFIIEVLHCGSTRVRS